MTREDEIKIIERVLSGDSDAFETLVLENQKNVFNLALKMTSNEQDALDISQEAFIKAYTHLGDFKGGSRFSVWLYRLTYNLCIDFLRKSRRAAVIPLKFTDADGEEIDMELPDLRYLPDTELEKKELHRALNEAIDALSPERRQVIILREITGLSYAEIAQVLGINEGSVKSRLSRARCQLANILMTNGTFSPDERRNSRRGGNAV